MIEEKVRQKLLLMKQNELVKKTDTEFQMMRRLQEADKNGISECGSCGRKYHFKEMDGGHYIAKSSKGNFGVRHYNNNCWPQCKRCNWHLSGNVAAFRERLLLKLGKTEVEWMESNKDLPVKVWLRGKLIDSYIECKKINKELKKRFK